MASVEELPTKINELKSIVDKIRTVNFMDIIKAEDDNLKVDAFKKIYEILELIKDFIPDSTLLQKYKSLVDKLYYVKDCPLPIEECIKYKEYVVSSELHNTFLDLLKTLDSIFSKISEECPELVSPWQEFTTSYSILNYVKAGDIIYSMYHNAHKQALEKTVKCFNTINKYCLWVKYPFAFECFDFIKVCSDDEKAQQLVDVYYIFDDFVFLGWYHRPTDRGLGVSVTVEGEPLLAPYCGNICGSAVGFGRGFIYVEFYLDKGTLIYSTAFEGTKYWKQTEESEYLYYYLYYRIENGKITRFTIHVEDDYGNVLPLFQYVLKSMDDYIELTITHVGYTFIEVEREVAPRYYYRILSVLSRRPLAPENFCGVSKYVLRLRNFKDYLSVSPLYRIESPKVIDYSKDVLVYEGSLQRTTISNVGYLRYFKDYDSMTIDEYAYAGISTSIGHELGFAVDIDGKVFPSDTYVKVYVGRINSDIRRITFVSEEGNIAQYLLNPYSIMLTLYTGVEDTDCYHIETGYVLNYNYYYALQVRAGLDIWAQTNASAPIYLKKIPLEVFELS